MKSRKAQQNLVQETRQKTINGKRFGLVAFFNSFVLCAVCGCTPCQL
jgi:hypothetical protein